uniref:Uncharacterized protein n=1 Tax=Thermogemmatispora argillosa TaxID=2045280 RepID=A0A455T1F2_9CHLR|nr:hypothetical protein KTA_18970 [Thermogemmatispora argillosa]
MRREAGGQVGITRSARLAAAASAPLVSPGRQAIPSVRRSSLDLAMILK